MKKIFCIFLMLVLCMGLSACGCEHEWQAANCEHPKTCALCGKTEGEPLSHSWQEADCEHPRTCTLCGKTEGEALGHIEGDWEKAKSDYIKAEQHYEKKCSRCQKVVDKKTKMIGQLHDGKQFLLTPAEFTKRADYVLRHSQEKSMYAEEGIWVDSYACRFMSGKEHIGAMSFLGDTDGDGDEEFVKSNGTFDSILSYARVDQSVGTFLIYMLQVFNPAISREEISEISVDIIESMDTKEDVQYNGAAYSAVYGNDRIYFIVGIPEK